jgi:ABC-type lipoprotein export system ATPase subunit
MLHLKQISLKFNQQIILDDISFAFPENGMFFLLGESGSGKSSLFNAIAGFVKLDSGEIWYGDLNLTKTSSKIIADYRHSIIGLVFQNYNLIPNLKIKDNFKSVSGSNKARYDRFLELLIKFGVRNLIDSYPYQASGGEQQRVALARTLSFNHKIVLADEPTGSLDSVSSDLVMKELYKRSKSALVIVITHDLELCEKFHAKVLNLKSGKIVGKTVNNIYYNPISLKAKSSSIRTIVKSSLISIKERRLYYLSLVFVTSMILLFLLTSLSFFVGVKSYIDYQSSLKLDGDYFSIYQLVNNESVTINNDEIDNLINYSSVEKDFQPLINNYFNQVFKLDDNAYYEVKVINGTNQGIKVNNLFYELHKKDQIILDGSILVPFIVNDSPSYEQILINKRFNITEVIKENKVYNVAKVYLTKSFLLTNFEDVFLPLIADRLKIEKLSFADYHLYYSAFLNLKGLRFNFLNNQERIEATKLLLTKENFITFFETRDYKNAFQLQINDEMFEKTLNELIESGNLIVTLVVLSLLFTLINISSLVLTFNFKKRAFELSIVKAYGANNFELMLLLLVEIAFIFLAIVLIVFLGFILISIILNFYLKINDLDNFNYLPLNLQNSLFVLVSLLIMLLIGSTDSIIKVFKLNVAEVLHHD